MRLPLALGKTFGNVAWGRMIEDQQVGVFPDGNASARSRYDPLASKIGSLRILRNRNVSTQSHGTHRPARHYNYRIFNRLRPRSDDGGRANQHFYIGSLAGGEQKNPCNCSQEFEHGKPQYRMRTGTRGR